jgi:DHA2 family multidrug resistance protein
MATLPQQQLGNATGIYNLMRNTGGSVGISILAFLLTRWTQVYTAILTENTSPYSPAFQNLFRQIRASLLTQNDIVTATQKTYGVVYGMIVRQAMVLAYIDCFWLLTVLCALGIPAAFLFKKVKNAKPIAGAH